MRPGSGRGCAGRATRAADAQDVDAPVGLEALVFNGDDGLAKDGGKAVVVDHLAPLQGK